MLWRGENPSWYFLFTSIKLPHIRTTLLFPTGYTFLIIAKNWFLTFLDEGVKPSGSKAHSRNGHRALGPSCSVRSSCLLMAGPQLSLVVTLALASSPGVCSPPEKWEIKGPVSVTLPSAAVTENPSSNWFKQTENLILFHWIGSLR